MRKVIVTLKRSVIKRPKDQKQTVQALGLNKLNSTVEHEATPQILGMIKKVEHLIEVKEI